MIRPLLFSFLIAAASSQIPQLPGLGGVNIPFLPRGRPESRGTSQSLDTLLLQAITNGGNPLVNIGRGLIDFLRPRRQDDGSSVVELDMQLSQQQLDAVQGSQSAAGIRDESFRWENAKIPYTFTSDFNDRHRATVRNAMDEWENFTCIRFMERTNERYFVTIKDTGTCQSQVGFVKDNRIQIMSLDTTYCLFHELIVHELAHTIGLHHEQTRPERDDFVTIRYENIENEHHHNFDKQAVNYTTDHGIMYDYRSVMHYGQRSFSNNGQNTIETKDPSYQNVIGTAPGASLKDIHAVNIMYRCTGQCGEDVRDRCPGVLGPECQCWCNSQDPKSPVTVWDGSSECPSVEAERRPACADQSSACEVLVRRNPVCDSNSAFLRTNCQRSCKWCPDEGDDGADGGDGNTGTGDGNTGNGNGNTGNGNGNTGTGNGNTGNGNGNTGTGNGNTGTGNGNTGTGDGNTGNGNGNTGTGDGNTGTGNGNTGNGNGNTGTGDGNTGTGDGNTGTGDGNTGDTNCRNLQDTCTTWAEQEYCSEYADYMSINCRPACGLCSETSDDSQGTGSQTGDDCKDLNDMCETWSNSGFCQTYRDYMEGNCRLSCALCANSGDNTDDQNGGGGGGAGGGAGAGDGDDCKDQDNRCKSWADSKFCDTYPDYMKTNCPLSCSHCGSTSNGDGTVQGGQAADSNQLCTDTQGTATCQAWARQNYCDTYKDYMEVNCRRSCRTCSPAAAGGRDRSVTTISSSTTTTTTPRPTQSSGADNSADCRDLHASCPGWASGGHCSQSRDYMERNCPRACRFCAAGGSSGRSTTRGVTVGDNGGRSTDRDGTTGNVACQDRISNCPSFVSQNYCTIYTDYMTTNCRKSCRLCSDQRVTQQPTTSPQCSALTIQCVDQGNCQSVNCEADVTRCPQTCRLCGSGSRCQDYSRSCRSWQSQNFCTSSPGYMRIYCPKSCQCCN